MAEQCRVQDNRLLAELPQSVLQGLIPFLERVYLQQHEMLYESGDPVRHVYFPTDAIVSLAYVMRSGASADSAIVGNDGMVGVALFMGGDTMPSHAVVLSSGYAYRLRGTLLKQEFSRSVALQNALLRYAQALLTQTAQTAVCNRHHTVHQQVCRWLLLSLDRVPGDDLRMTQELLANTLGVRREGVTEVAGRLQSAGVIQYKRGHIRVTNRPKLESMACECYSVVKLESDRLLSRMIAA